MPIDSSSASNNLPCIGVTWAPTEDNGDKCFLKYSSVDNTTNPEQDCAVLVNSTNSNPFNSSDTTNYGPVNPCPYTNGTVHSVSATGNLYRVDCGIEYLYDDLTSLTVDNFDGCITACDEYIPSPSVANNASCVAMSYDGVPHYGANCFLKYALSGQAYYDPNLADSAVKYTYIDSTASGSGSGSGSGNPECTTASSTFVDCPGGNGTLYSPSGNNTDVYQIFCQTLTSDYNLGSQHNTPDLLTCLNDCENWVPATGPPGTSGIQPCVGVNYYTGPYNSNNCQLHYSTISNTSNSDFTTAAKLNCTGTGFRKFTYFPFARSSFKLIVIQRTTVNRRGPFS